MILGREPVVVLAMIDAVIMLALAFGVDLSTEQIAAIMTAVLAVSAFVVRAQSTPIIDPRTNEGVPLVEAIEEEGESL